MRTIFAQISVNGTAISETALCAYHENEHNVAKFYASPTGDLRADGLRLDVSGNEVLSCQECGW